MSDFFSRLVGAGELSLSDPSVRLRFEHALPAWAWTGMVVVCIGLGIWSYWRLDVTRPARVILGAVRALALLALVVLAMGPRLVKQEERVERDWAVVLVDRSRSMLVEDAPSADGPGSSTRESQLRSAIDRARESFSTMAGERSVSWLGFGAGAFPLGTGAPVPDLGEPDGHRTSIAAALERAVREVAARPASGIILISDGRSIDQPSRALLRRLEAAQLPVYVVPLGTSQPRRDLALGRVEATRVAFAGDPLVVTAEITSSGAAGQGTVDIELVDSATGAVVERTSVELDESGKADAALTTSVNDPGDREFTLRIAPGGDDLTATNNTADVRVRIVDQPIRVLYIDGYPRWESRYLKNLLVREKSIRSSSLLLSADKQYMQEGSEQIVTMPVTASDFEPFDVIIIGDVRAEIFSDDQLRALRDHIAQKAGGVLWIAGSGATPTSWLSRPLADLIPFRVGSQGDQASVPAFEGPVVMSPTPLASRLGLLRLGERPTDPWPARLSDPATGWSLLWWAQRIERSQLKPGAEVIAEFGSASGSRTPAVITMRYGAGRSAYVATDEIWRWRFGRGEALYERFWLPLIRSLARERVARSGRPAAIEITPAAATVGEPVRIALRIFDQSIIDARADGDSIRVSIAPDIPGQGAGADQATEVLLTPDGPGSWSGSWTPSEPGEYRAAPSDAALASSDVRTRFLAIAPDDELRVPQADHESLAALARQTGGAVVMPDQLSTLATILPNRQVRTLGEPVSLTLWDRPIALALPVFLFALEWFVRRYIRLA